jgi:hypothetical protein
MNWVSAGPKSHVPTASAGSEWISLMESTNQKKNLGFASELNQQTKKIIVTPCQIYQLLRKPVRVLIRSIKSDPGVHDADIYSR